MTPGRSLHRSVWTFVASLLLLAAAGAHLPAQAVTDEASSCSTKAGSTTPFYGKPSASGVYDGTFTAGVPLAHGLINNRYTPQGLASWPNWDGHGEDVLLVSAYRDPGATTSKDPRYEKVSAVYGIVASGTRTGTSLGRMLLDTEAHVGGLAVSDGYLYVAVSRSIVSYPLGTVRSVLDAGNTNALNSGTTAGTSTFTIGFLGSGDGRLWAGDFDEDEDTTLSSYAAAGAGGALGPAVDTKQVVPRKTQGVAVTSAYTIFSTSFGRHDESNLWVVPRNQQTLTDARSYCFSAPSMSEGLAVLGDTLYVSFESGAYTYTKNKKNLPRNVITDTHRAPLAAVTGLYTSRPVHP